MTGHRKFADLVAEMPPERRARIKLLTEEMRREMDLAQLRTARQLSQAALGEILHVEQPAVAKLEKRTDMYVSTLRRFIQAMGGELEITARFADHAVRIKNFGDLGKAGRARRSRNHTETVEPESNAYDAVRKGSPNR
jgi:transcriptional regulator with XRE-family HTH domain